MEKREYISNIKPNSKCKVAGFIETIRDQKKMQFIVLKDRSGLVQVTVDKEAAPKIAETFSALTINSVVEITGDCVENKIVKQGGVEILPQSVKVLSVAETLPISEDSSIDVRLDNRWVDLRQTKKYLIFEIQSYLTQMFREFLYKNKFIEIHTPKLINAASESGSDVFELKYFERKAYLSQSPQFYKQMAMASGFERIFETGPVFRAEKSNTLRHATEFTGFDLEISYIDSFEDVMKLEEELIHYALTGVKEKYGEKIKEYFNTEVVVPSLPFPRVKLADMYEEFEKRGEIFHAREKDDLNVEGERLAYQIIKEKYGHEFVFITDYPPKKRAFYHMRENGMPQGFDLIWKGTEITTGAQREHRYDVLKAQAKEKGLGKDVDFYLEFFKYGCPPHGGFGIGLDRLTMLLLNINSIKEIMFIFRGPDRLTP